MLVMACRNRVNDFATWQRVFESHREAHLAAGLTLRFLGRGLDDPDQIFYSFDVADLERAKAFIHAPDAAEVGRSSGVIDGEYRFIDGAADYR